MQASEANGCGLIDARGEAPWRVVGGIRLVTRLVRGLELAGLERILVVCDRPLEPEALEAARSETRLSVRCLQPGAPLAEAAAELSGESEFLVADGALVVDLRLQAALARSPAPTFVPCPGSDMVRLARLSGEQLAVYGAPADPALGWQTLEPESLDTWSTKLRGHQEILLLDASSPEVAARAETLLIERTQKMVMDWPARWIDPHFEYAMVRRLAPTRPAPRCSGRDGWSPRSPSCCSRAGWTASTESWFACASRVAGWETRNPSSTSSPRTAGTSR